MLEMVVVEAVLLAQQEPAVLEVGAQVAFYITKDASVVTAAVLPGVELVYLAKGRAGLLLAKTLVFIPSPEGGAAPVEVMGVMAVPTNKGVLVGLMVAVVGGRGQMAVLF